VIRLSQRQNIKAGTKLIARHNFMLVVAHVARNGDIVIDTIGGVADGRRFKSLSAASLAIRGKKMNGFDFFSIVEVDQNVPAVAIKMRARKAGHHFAIEPDSHVNIANAMPAPKAHAIAHEVAHNVANDLPATLDGWRAWAKDKLLLGMGASRAVYAIDDKRVVKINSGGNNWGDCASEAQYFNNADAETRECLATIYACGDGWLVMERAKSTLHAFTNDPKTTSTITSDLKSVVKNVGDLHPANIGYFGKGRFKVIDYACVR
jgi:hypothetical protein